MEAYQLTIPVDDYLELLKEIEQIVPLDKSSVFWKIISILENKREIINPIKGKLYY
jgi:hypothetical protein